MNNPKTPKWTIKKNCIVFKHDLWIGGLTIIEELET